MKIVLSNYYIVIAVVSEILIQVCNCDSQPLYIKATVLCCRHIAMVAFCYHTFDATNKRLK